MIWLSILLTVLGSAGIVWLVGPAIVLGWITTKGRWKWAAAFAGAALVALLIFQVRTGRNENEALTDSLAASQGEVALLRQARQADSAALTDNSARKAIISKGEAIGRKRTEAALAAHPAWANQPVPADVLASLRD
jgi:hypothetical protein